MSLPNGHRLGPYEILAPLGAGGMGEVYRARDTRLGREVAIKVVPDFLAGEPEIRARFEREARAASALNHPHIVQVYDVGREGDVDYIVMELLEGESLAERVRRGPIPTAETLRLSGQIADALDRAHRAGILHRDLKPGNVMVTKQGAKLLDFGLARPTGLGPNRAGTPSSPTMSGPLTAAGAIVGTFQYMAPEQLEGAEADARCDVWALGATMYEMATGHAAFEGKSQASLIASILGKEPRPIAELAPLTPPPFERLVQSCLAKDPEERVQTAHDARLQLKWIAEGGSQAGVPAPIVARRKARERLAWGLVAALGLVALGALGWIAAQALGPKPVKRAVRFVVATPPRTNNVGWPRLSPDGAMLMFQASDSLNQKSIWVRPLASTVAYRLAGTENTGRPFWSPDSREIGFFAGGKLKKISVGGGPVQLVADAANASDGAWTPRLVLFDGAAGDSIRGIPSQGGAPVAASSFDRRRGEIQHAWPSPLPDGKHFLFQAFRSGSNVALIKLGTIGSLASVVVDSSDSRAEFLPPNHLVYVREGAVIARRFDLARGKVVGEPIVIGENAGTSANTQSFSTANDGSLAFQSNGSSRFVVNRRDRKGKLLAQVVPPGAIQFCAISPDGAKLAVDITDNSDAQSGDLWIRDLARGTQARFTFNAADDSWPTWSPDGSELAFTSNRPNGYDVWIKPASGIRDEARIPGLKVPFAGPTGFSPDGKFLLVTSQDPQTSWDVWAVPLADAAHPIAIATTSFSESIARISPDGRFVVYAANPSGPTQIFVQPFPNATARWQVAEVSGAHPFWTKGGKEIVFRGPGGVIYAVPVELGADGTFNAGTPEPLFGTTLAGFSPGRWCPSPDGETFYTVDPEASREDPFPITVLLDANAELAGR